MSLLHTEPENAVWYINNYYNNHTQNNDDDNNIIITNNVFTDYSSYLFHKQLYTQLLYLSIQVCTVYTYIYRTRMYMCDKY